MAGPTAEEQLYLELINEARLNPLSNAGRYIASYSPLTSSDSDIQFALNFFSVSGTALQEAYSALTAVGPVAWNDALGTAAEKHSAAMIAADSQSHQLPGESSLGVRVTSEGYIWNTLAENVYAYSESILFGHAGFMVDWGAGVDGMQSPPGHRNAIMNAAYREVGIDVTLESDGATSVGPQVVTQDFGARSGKYFVLGVAYMDTDTNHFYSVGEGRDDLTVQSGALSVVSAVSGGYSLGVGTGAISVSLSGGGLAGTVTVSTTITTENIKLDVVGGNTLLSSGSIVVLSGTISVIRAIGVQGVSLTGNVGDQSVEGNAGNDTLNGGAGNDTLVGNGGTDKAVYSGNRADYHITQEGTHYRLIDQRAGANDGNDLTIGVEHYQFADGIVLTANLLGGGGGGGGNDAPVVANAITDQTLPEDAPWSLTVPANTFTDLDGDLLTYSATQANGSALPAWLTFTAATRTFSGTPPANFNGALDLKVTASDGSLSTSDTFTLTVTPVNDAPVAGDDSIEIAQSKAASIVASALLDNDTDVEGDTITVTDVANATNGTVVLDAGVISFTPTSGFSGEAGFDYTASDGQGGSDSGHVTVTVLANLPPQLSSKSQSLTALPQTAVEVVVLASDLDDDPLTYSASDPAHGTVTGGTGGFFTFTPDAGYLGADTFTVTVDDGNGATATQTITVTVTELPGAENFRLFAADGFAGAIGGPGQVFGSTGFQDITVIDQAGRVVFDPSFNRGGDIIRLTGTAAQWQIVRAGSSALLTDGDTFAQVPLGTAGTALVFDDGARTLKVEAGTFRIGSQTFAAALETITASTDGTVLPSGLDPAAQGRLFLSAGADVSAGGRIDIFGTASPEPVSLLSGTVTFDPSFNKGGDVISFTLPAEAFLASRTGSSVFLDSATTDARIPIGTAGTTLAFAGDDERTLLFNASLGAVTIADQAITATPGSLTAFG